MIQIRFKNLEKSELVMANVIDRVEAIIQKFEDLENSRIRVTLEMQNSPVQPGLDAFTVKLHIFNGRYAGITVVKTDPQLFRALAEMIDHMLELLNRAGDKNRVRERKKARELITRNHEPKVS